MRYLIYMHTNRTTGKSYVGFTRYSMERRWRIHMKAVTGGSQAAFHRSIVKHGRDVWDHTLLDVVTTFEGAKCAEIVWIAHATPIFLTVTI